MGENRLKTYVIDNLLFFSSSAKLYKGEKGKSELGKCGILLYRQPGRRACGDVRKYISFALS